MYGSLTENDRVTSGDSGAGYVNPTQLLRPREISGLAPADDIWAEHNKLWYNKFDIQFTGFLINGAAGPMTDEAERLYNSFSPYGGTEQTGYAPGGKTGVHLQRGVPYFQEMDIPGDEDEATRQILGDDNVNAGVQFHVYRSILQSPTYHFNVMNKVQAQSGHVVVVEPLALSILAQLHLK